MTIDLNDLTHEALEIVSEDATEYLTERNIRLVSHSYQNIILQAIKHGFIIND